MRVALICGPKAEALRRFSEILEAAHPSVAWLRFPEESPLVVAAIEPGHNPAIQGARSADGSFLIIDGEIFDLPGRQSEAAQPGDNNDAAELLALYQMHGTGIFDRIDASASIVLWDADAGRLSVYRDRYGLVPSFYSQQAGYTVWGSDIPSLLPFVEDTSTNLAAMDFLLKDGFIPAPWTFAKAVAKLQPAHCLTVEGNGEARETRYWLPQPGPTENLGASATVERIGELLTQSLARRSGPEARLGVMLSGGVDSKLLAATLRLKLDRDLDSFTFHYEDYDGVYNENTEARRAADFLGTNHHEVSFGPNQIAERFTSLIQAYGEPFTSGLHTAMLGDVANAGIAQLFNGAGADGWYIGNRNHHGMRAMAVPGPLRQAAKFALPLLRTVNGKKASALASVLNWAPDAYHDHFHLGITDLSFRQRLYQDPSWIPAAHGERNRLFALAAEDFKSHSLRDKLIFLHSHYYLADHVFYWNHCWSRAHDLAARSPYFDATLMDFVLRLPRENLNKEELRQLAITMIPRDMAYTSKFPQSLPIGPWFRGPLKDFIRDKLSAKRVSESGLFKNDVLQPLITEHINGGQGFGMALWAILAIIEWQELVAKGQLARPARQATTPQRRSAPAA